VNRLRPTQIQALLACPTFCRFALIRWFGHEQFVLQIGWTDRASYTAAYTDLTRLTPTGSGTREQSLGAHGDEVRRG
jgi:hypothetical protein